MELNWPDLLSGLVGGNDLGADESAAAFGEIMDGNVEPAVTAAFLTALAAKGETGPEISGLASAMIAHAVPVEAAHPLLDTCGTGGDRSGTVNVSTMAAFVCAGAGVRVAKHGNRSASSKCGSADVLEALGVQIALGPEAVARCIDEAGIGFMFAQAFHPAMKHVMPVRKALGIRTVFNLIGPLSNPARAEFQVVGVSDLPTAPIVAAALGSLGVKRALVVHGADGLDELSTTGASNVWDTDGETIAEYEIDPADFALAPATPDDLRGGDAEQNASVTRDVLAGKPGAVRDIVVLNAAAGLVAAGVAEHFSAGISAAAAAIDSGAAAASLDKLVQVSNA